MKKMLFGLLLIFGIWAGNAFAQVLFDFEDGTTQGYFDNGWGPGFKSVTWAADPSGVSKGVLALNFDGAAGQKGDLQVNNLKVDGAHMLNYWIWLPANFPDSIVIKLWAQDDKNWAWTEQAYNGRDIPKEKWYPITFNMAAKHAAAPAKFDHIKNKLGKSGIEVATWNEHDADAKWSGNIYLDNIGLIGVSPSVFADFEDGTTQKFFDNGWGKGFTSVVWAADPSGVSKGVLAVTFDGTAGDKGDLQVDNLDPKGNNVLAYWVWLPASFPDSLVIKLWAQDNKTWSWNDVVYNGRDIPKEIWYPLYFNMDAKNAADPSKFDHKTAKIGKAGLEIARWYEHDADAKWSGTIYVDNASFLGSGARWIRASFENQTAGKQGFENTGWGPSLTGLGWASDATGQSVGVLNTNWDFKLGVKGAFENGNVNIFSAELDTFAHKMSIDVFIPADMPHGAQVSIFVRDHKTWTWTEDKFFISDSGLVPGKWNRMVYDVLAHVAAGEVDPQAGLSVGCQVYYSVAQTWAGSVYWDNFTLWGIPEPKGTLASPTVTATLDTVAGANVARPWYYNHIRWVDNTVGTETYNIYLSLKPITNVTAEGVILIADKIPHGQEQWGHRPWSRDGAEKTYYYAVTATGTDGTETPLTEICKTGAMTITTSVTAKAQYVGDFANKFVLDGLDTEFEQYKTNSLKPHHAGGTYGPDWTSESTDMNFSTTMVIDDDYLYISAEVTDDDLRQPPGQAWEGDALEFFVGFYNVNLLKAYHPYKSVGQAGTGDWRISFTAWGTVQLSGTTETTIPGVETTVFQKFTGDGYIIEARLALDSLAGPEGLQVIDGAMLPLSIDGNDMDPSFGDASRSLQVYFGGSGATHEGWMRPSTWGMLEVLGGPVGVAENTDALPKAFKLHQNYPNPFNPTTRISYELPRATQVSVVIYDLLGQRVRTLVDSKKTAGVHMIEWNGRSDANIPMASGMYFYKIETPEFSQVAKMMLLK